jgi:hypothetical protein
MMPQARFKSLINGMTATAKKVYAAVPIQEMWTPQQIQAELARTNMIPDFRTLQGCLRHLTDAGLVLERGSKPSAYSRAPVKPEKPTAMVTPTTAPKPTPVKSPLDKIGDLAARLRNLADDLDSCAVEIEEQFTTAEKQSERFKQLQQLLSGTA